MKMPCDGCITVGICRNIQKNRKKDGRYLSQTLMDRCDLLTEYINYFRGLSFNPYEETNIFFSSLDKK